MFLEGLAFPQIVIELKISRNHFLFSNVSKKPYLNCRQLSSSASMLASFDLSGTSSS
jgi:hypothetical protein